MLKKQLTESLKQAIINKDKDSVRTLRLILAVLKDKEISERSNGKSEEISDDEVLSLLRKMIKQRKESVELYKKGKRDDLANNENKEIKIIEKYLPIQLSDKETKHVCKETILQLSVNNLQDMGRVMNELKNKFNVKIDMMRASVYVKEILNKNTE
tara:strand:+ start:142 stop:609 length:468 start_codon:yes stop_codon:yes gene_type:complete